MKPSELLAIEVSGDGVVGIHAKSFWSSYRLALQLVGATCPAAELGKNLIYVHPRADVQTETVAITVLGQSPKRNENIAAFFLVLRRSGESSTWRVDLEERGIAPAHGRNLAIHYYHLVASVGGVVLDATGAFKHPVATIHFPDTTTLMRWGFGELSDEELLAAVGEVEREKSAVERVEELEAELDLQLKKTQLTVDALLQARVYWRSAAHTIYEMLTFKRNPALPQYHPYKKLSWTALNGRFGLLRGALRDVARGDAAEEDRIQKLQAAIAALPTANRKK